VKVKATLPRHIAIILDGNGRWAHQRGKPITDGHWKGVDTLERILDYAQEIGIQTVTLYAFSSENWKRSEGEKRVLFRILEHFFKNKIKKIIRKNVRLKMIGDIAKFPLRIRAILKAAETSSKKNTGSLIQIALSYGGRDEIIRAIKKCIKQVSAKRIKLGAITEESFKSFLDTGIQDDPDLLIRTGGDMRVSNFLLYQIAYTELYVTKTLWPDFTPRDLDLAIEDFSKRERRFGARK
jgi:undecaprenyl diphosphate synthase